MGGDGKRDMPNNIENITKNLNPEQLEAVTWPNESVLILAGAGTGKTQVLTSRIAYILAKGDVPPHRIMAVTFTNKAANEMKERVNKMAGRRLDGMWIGTFHGLCNKFLRYHRVEAGLGSAYSVMDADTQKAFFKNLYEMFTKYLKSMEFYQAVMTGGSSDDGSRAPYNVTDGASGTSGANAGHARTKPAMEEWDPLVAGISDDSSGGRFGDEDLSPADLGFQEFDRELAKKRKFGKNQDAKPGALLEVERTMKKVAMDFFDEFSREFPTGSGVKSILRSFGSSLDKFEENNKPSNVVWRINQYKDKGKRAFNVPQDDFGDEFDWLMVKNLYLFYDMACDIHDNVDFAELMLRSYETLTSHPELREHYSQRFKHILVDEFQDTSDMQFKWLELFRSDENCYFVVGDDDQSIYSFRGANVSNMRKFIKAHKVAKHVTLVKNYRSQATILEAANEVIHNNDERLGKNLEPTIQSSGKITVVSAPTGVDEAKFVAHEAAKLVLSGFCHWKDIAILYRMNHLSNNLEYQLKISSIPHRIFGGLRFFDRSVVKNAMAYIALVVDEDNDIAFRRIINVPPRGIGPKSIEELEIDARRRGVSLMAAARSIAKNKGGKFATFASLIDALQESADRMSFSEFANKLVVMTGLKEHHKERDDKNKLKNVDSSEHANLLELLEAIRQFDADHSTRGDLGLFDDVLEEEAKAISIAALEAGEAASGGKGSGESNEDAAPASEEDLTPLSPREKMLAFLQDSSLDVGKNYNSSGEAKFFERQDAMERANEKPGKPRSEGEKAPDAEAAADEIQLMTVHAAKGLEFKAVFIVGVEEGTFPVIREFTNEAPNFDEERRLMYVAMTRAKERLYISYSEKRKRTWSDNMGMGSKIFDPDDFMFIDKFPSRFIEEIPESKIDAKKAVITNNHLTLEDAAVPGGKKKLQGAMNESMRRFMRDLGGKSDPLAASLLAKDTTRRQELSAPPSKVSAGKEDDPIWDDEVENDDELEAGIEADGDVAQDYDEDSNEKASIDFEEDVMEEDGGHEDEEASQPHGGKKTGEIGLAKSFEPEDEIKDHIEEEFHGLYIGKKDKDAIRRKAGLPVKESSPKKRRPEAAAKEKSSKNFGSNKANSEKSRYDEIRNVVDLAIKRKMAQKEKEKERDKDKELEDGLGDASESLGGSIGHGVQPPKASDNVLYGSTDPARSMGLPPTEDPNTSAIDRSIKALDEYKRRKLEEIREIGIKKGEKGWDEAANASDSGRAKSQGLPSSRPDLGAPKSSEPPMLRPGDMVEHSSYGMGKVRQVRVKSKQTVVDIRFNRYGEKSLVYEIVKNKLKIIK